MTDKHILIIEDKIAEARNLQYKLDDLGFDQTTICRNAKEALPVINKGEFDLALVDVELENSKLNGVALAKKIKELWDTPIVFLTGMDDENTTNKILEIENAEHLLKDTEQLDKGVAKTVLRVHIQRAFAKKNKPKPLANTTSGCPFKVERESIFIKTKDYHTRIDIDKINYLQSHLGSYTMIFLEDNTSHIASVSLKNFIPKFDNSNLIRIHNSFAINKAKVTDINSKVVILSNKKDNPIPIGKTYKSVIKLHFDTLASD